MTRLDCHHPGVRWIGATLIAGPETGTPHVLARSAGAQLRRYTDPTDLWADAHRLEQAGDDLARHLNHPPRNTQPQQETTTMTTTGNTADARYAHDYNGTRDIIATIIGTPRPSQAEAAHNALAAYHAAQTVATADGYTIDPAHAPTVKTTTKTEALPAAIAAAMLNTFTDSAAHLYTFTAHPAPTTTHPDPSEPHDPEPTPS